MSAITQATVKHIAQLAHIPVDDAEVSAFQKAFEETLEVVDQLKQVDVSKVAPTYQVTGLHNVWREDLADTSRTFTQQQALQNAPKQHDGYFVVPRLIGGSE